MRVVVLPGYSSKNAEWLQVVSERLEKNFELLAWRWAHWDNLNDRSLSVIYEAIVKEIGSQPFHLVAKSIGTWVGMKVLQQVDKQAEKVLLCGLPLLDSDTTEEEKRDYQILRTFEPNKVLVLQNEGDSHGSFAQAQSFIAEINEGIVVEKMLGDTHEYVYLDKIEAFLNGSGKVI